MAKVPPGGTRYLSCGLLAFLGLIWPQPVLGQIERVWLTHKTNDPGKLVINWQTKQSGNSVVHYGLSKEYGLVVTVEESVALHHVEIPLTAKGQTYHYRVVTGIAAAAEGAFKAYLTDTLRVAVVADWQARPKLDTLLQDDPHLLLTADDNIDSLHRLCGVGVKDCVKPYAPAAQCSTVPPSRWPPQRISVRPPASSFVSPSQKTMASSDRMTHWRSAACR